MSTYRIPTEAEAEALADDLAARGYTVAEAVRRWRIVQDCEGDLCLILEGPSYPILAAALEALGPDDDENPHRPVANWKNALAALGMLTLASRGGCPEALDMRASDLEFIRANWK